MVDVRLLSPGDRVKIAEKWAPSAGGHYRCDSDGLMDHWLGKIMTVRYVYSGEDPFIRCEEDAGEFHGRGWNWFPEFIEYVVENETDAPLTASNMDISNFLLRKVCDSCE